MRLIDADVLIDVQRGHAPALDSWGAEDGSPVDAVVMLEMPTSDDLGALTIKEKPDPGNEMT